MRVAAYIRVSTDEQVEQGNSLVEQEERLKAYCVSQLWDEPVIFSDDGVSAKNTNRPYLKKLVKRIEDREFDIVLTTKIDRLGRSLLDLLQLVNLFKEYDCGYASSSEQFDTSTSVGRMTLQLLGTFAEFERERISERVKDNMTSLAKNTDKALGIACFGYSIENKRYVINEDEAKHVRYMFLLAEQGHGHRMIAKMLNESGSTTRKNKMWDQVNIKKLMTNEMLSGVMVYNKRGNKNGKTVIRDKNEWIIKEDNHPAIIALENFEKVQLIFKARSRSHKHADNESYLLTGLVKCKHCGGNMKGSTARYKRKSGEYAYYRYICSSYVLGYGCKHHAFHRDPFEKHIIGEIEKANNTTSKNLNLKIAMTISDEDEKEDVKRQLTRIDKRMQKQIEAYENDLISADDLKSASSRVENERKLLRDKLDKLEKKQGDVQEVKSNISKLLGDVTGEDRLKAKKALALLIEEIVVEDGKMVDITWR